MAAVKEDAAAAVDDEDGSGNGNQKDVDVAATTAATTARGAASSELTELERQRLSEFERSPDLQQLCIENGLTAQQFARKSSCLTKLDMFLGFWPSMQSVGCFPALRELAITKHPTISSIQGLASCPNLEVLAITECALERIAGLETCCRLRRLNLSSNKLVTIEALDSLVELETLWLNDNRIAMVGGLQNAHQLKTLWICSNQIERVDSALSACANLTELNMSNNRICSFKHLLPLASLPSLAVLSLSDPHFGENPVCRLCNYHTFVMCTLQTLTWLDTIELPAHNKQIAEATMLKKTMYYNMRMKAVERDTQLQVQHAEEIAALVEQQHERHAIELERQQSELTRVLSSRPTTAAKDSLLSAARHKLACIDQLLHAKRAALTHMLQDLERLRVGMQIAASTQIARLQLELETGGNVRLEDGTSSDAWVVSCIEFVRSRVNLAELATFGIADVQVARVTRLSNRYLRTRFHARMDAILAVDRDVIKANVSKTGVTVPVEDDDDEVDVDDEDEDDEGGRSCRPDNTRRPTTNPPAKGSEKDKGDIRPAKTTDAVQNKLEYLFYVLPPQLMTTAVSACTDAQSNYTTPAELLRIAECGFRPPSEYARLGVKCNAIKLANTLAVLEHPEASCASPRRSSSITSRSEQTRRPSVLLVAKVFAGCSKTVLEQDAPVQSISREQYAGLQSVQVVRSMQENDGEAVGPRLFYVFDEALVLPEYIVEYNYAATSETTGAADVTHMAGLDLDTFEQRYRQRNALTPTSSSPSPLQTLDEDVRAALRLVPSVDDTTRVLPPAAALNSSAWLGLRELNLMGAELTSVPDVSALQAHLECLVLRDNRIEALDDNLRGLTQLTRLDLASNRLHQLSHLDDLTALQVLLLSQNQLSMFDDVQYLARLAMAKTLRHLDLRWNPLGNSKRCRLHVLQQIPSIDCLDQREITRTERDAAARLLTSLSPEVIHARWRASHPQASTAIKDADTNEFPPASHSIVDQINRLDVSHELLSSTQGIESFTHLRVLCLADNAITCLEGLASCNLLEELDISHNLLTAIESLDQLPRLSKLNASYNQLVAIQGLEHLDNLVQVCLDHNAITSLHGLGTLARVMELYASHNAIVALPELQHLKTLPKLTVLDLASNPVTQHAEYRLYTIFHVRRLKVLDGRSLTAQDQAQAKQKYSGKLTIELLLDKCAPSIHLERVQDLNLASCGLRELGNVLDPRVLPNVKHLNLEDNQLSELSPSVLALPRLRVLNVTRNRIERLLPSAVPATSEDASATSARSMPSIEMCAHLEHLLLAFNRMADMALLQLDLFPSLQVLHVQGNAITQLNSLEANSELIELRADKNKIRQVDGRSIAAMTKLAVLSLEENQLKSLEFANDLAMLETLDVSSNRLAELDDIDPLSSVSTLVDLRMLHNAVSKKHQYRLAVIAKLTALRMLDGREITPEERERAEALFLHDRGNMTAVAMTTADPSSITDNIVLSSPIASSNPSTCTSMLRTLPPSVVPGAPLLVMTTAGPRALIPPLFAVGDVLAGSLLKKSPVNSPSYSANQQAAALQFVPTHATTSMFTKPEPPPSSVETTAPMVIVPAQATPKTLLNMTLSHVPPPLARIATSSNVITSNNNATALAPTAPPQISTTLGNPHGHLAAVRSERRRISSVRYDPTASTSASPSISTNMPANTTLASGLVSSHAVLRAPSLSLQAARPIMPVGMLGADSEPMQSLSGYVVTYGQHKRHASLQDVGGMEFGMPLPLRDAGRSRPR